MRPILAEEFLQEQNILWNLLLLEEFEVTPADTTRVLLKMQNPHLQWVVLFKGSRRTQIQSQKIGFRATSFGTSNRYDTYGVVQTDGSIAVGEIGARPPGAQF